MTTTECTQHHPACGCDDAQILDDLRRGDCILVTAQVPWRDRLLTRTMRVSKQVLAEPTKIDVLALVVRDVVRDAERKRQQAVDAAAPRWSPQQILDILDGKVVAPGSA